MNNKKIIFILIFITLIFSLSNIDANNTESNYTQESDNNTEEGKIVDMIDDITQKYNLNDDENQFTLLSMKNDTEIEDTAVLDKSKPIYFAMDHVNRNDTQIRDTIVNRLEDEGFSVVSAEIGPNKMSRNTRYIYDNNISNVIIFHLFNGVDPSTIRELGTNGDDNRGRIVRSNGNDVVLAWFYDSADCVNENGSGVNYVYGSETGPSLSNPKQYMEDNNIIGICTSSDMGNHKENADYTGEKTVEEFIKLFE